MASTRLVYSTGGDNTCPDCGRELRKCRCRNESAPVVTGDGIIRIQRECKGRGGKEVCLISGLPLPADDLKKLARRLKAACGTGGTVQQHLIEIQGDQRQKLKSLLEKEGYEVRISGG